jgi:TolA-binding protein
VHYWLGEIALLENRYPQAEASFSEVVSRYQESGKLQDARYKLAITHLKMGETEKAKTELLAIEQQNAGNTVARLAKLQLQELS